MTEKITKPILRWPGGKSRQREDILRLIRPHRTWCEVFVGGGAITFAKERSPVEVINDINGTIVALYRNVQHHMPAVLDEIEFILNSRQDLKDFVQQAGLTEIQRAARFLVRNKLSFSGNGYSFSTPSKHGGGSGAGGSREYMQERIWDLNHRLDRVIIENLPWQQCVETYDSTKTLFFFDPPYLNAKPAAYKGWTAEQMTEFRNRLENVKGNYIITVDGSDFNRRLFKGHKIRQASIRNGCIDSSKHGRRDFKEFIITKT